MEAPERQIDSLHGSALVLPRLIVCVKELYYLCGYLASILATLVQMRPFLQTYQRGQKVWRRNQTLQYGVHEARVVLTILQTQKRVVLVVSVLGEQS